MFSSHIAAVLLIAVLVFWMVGAYNRLVSLRGNVSRRFQPVDEQVMHRHAVLIRWVDALRPRFEPAVQPLEAVRAACAQVQAALEALRRHPAAERHANTLRVAEETLSQARARVQHDVQQKDDATSNASLQALQDELASADTTLGFACRHFNEACALYNAARRQFPTWMVASLFGFGGAGSL